jgi:hypothetical protein
MSWNTGTKNAVAKDAITVDYPQLFDTVEAEQRAQIDAAVEAARALAAVVGRSDDEVHVTLTGHANPSRAPRAGWANETITVTVTARPVATT